MSAWIVTDELLSLAGLPPVLPQDTMNKESSAITKVLRTHIGVSATHLLVEEGGFVGVPVVAVEFKEDCGVRDGERSLYYDHLV